MGIVNDMSIPPRFNFFSLVARNLRSRPFRTTGMIFIFAIIAASLFSAQYLASGATESLDRGTRWIGADLTVVPEDAASAGESSILTGSPAMFFFSNTGFEKISRIPGIAQADPQIMVATLAGASCCSDFLQIIAVDPGRDFTLSPWLRDNPKVVLGKDAIVVGSEVQGDIGSGLIFYGHPFHIAGRLEPTGMRGIDQSVFIRMEDAYTMADESVFRAEKPLVLPRGMVSSVLVQLDPGASPAIVGDAIRREIPGTRILTRDDMAVTVTRHLAGITQFLHNATIALVLVSLPVLAVISLVLARETKQEITLLGMLGATKAFILRLILAESFSASIIGSLAGIGSAALFLIAFEGFIAFSLEIPFGIPSVSSIVLDGGIAFILTIMVGGLASLYPTLKLIRSETYRSIGNNET
jgi:putative ABC transport system permease protein